jgi:hypothetical protein
MGAFKLLINREKWPQFRFLGGGKSRIESTSLAHRNTNSKQLFGTRGVFPVNQFDARISEALRNQGDGAKTEVY